MRLLRAIAVPIGVLAALAAAPASADTYPVHGRVLAVPGPGIAIVAVTAEAGTHPAQTRQFHIAGKDVNVGDEIDAYLDPATETLSDVAGARNTEGVSQASIVLDASVFTEPG